MSHFSFLPHSLPPNISSFHLIPLRIWPAHCLPCHSSYIHEVSLALWLSAFLSTLTPALVLGDSYLQPSTALLFPLSPSWPRAAEIISSILLSFQLTSITPQSNNSLTWIPQFPSLFSPLKFQNPFTSLISLWVIITIYSLKYLHFPYSSFLCHHSLAKLPLWLIPPRGFPCPCSWSPECHWRKVHNLGFWSTLLIYLFGCTRSSLLHSGCL